MATENSQSATQTTEAMAEQLTAEIYEELTQTQIGEALAEVLDPERDTKKIPAAERMHAYANALKVHWMYLWGDWYCAYDNITWQAEDLSLIHI